MIGFADEVWWSRLVQPNLQSWSAATDALRLCEKTIGTDDPDPKALACYGVLLRATPTIVEQIWLRFATGQPVSGLTTQFLAWCGDTLAALGTKAWLLVWDNASWHTSQAVRRWIRTHNRTVKEQRQGVRIVACLLPVKRPWLNPIAPPWLHGKRAVLEAERLLPAAEVETRVYA